MKARLGAVIMIGAAMPEKLGSTTVTTDTDMLLSPEDVEMEST
jgi:hypothetical protein